MLLYLYLIAGGAVGVVARHQLWTWLTPARGGSYPLPTLLINVSGSLLLGFLMRYLATSSASKESRAMLITGLCGGFTTFSTFSYETVELLTNGRIGAAATYTGISVVASVVACYAGYMLADLAFRR